ncbi:MAG: FISUMP domain-containing protein [Dysgonomonas sp.]
MKQNLLLLWILLFLFTCIDAQVTIGSNYEPNKGALLDLKEKNQSNGTENSTKGMGFPRVMLIDKNNLFPMFDGSSSGVPNNSYDTPSKKEAEDAAHIGLIVFNMNDNPLLGFCKGIYVWQGEEWIKLGEECYTPSLSLDKATDRVLTSETTQLTATHTPSNSTITWTSSDPTIATVNANGLVTTLREGDVTVTATMTYNENILSATCAIEVKDLIVKIMETNIRLVTGTTFTPTITTSPSWANINTSAWNRISGTSATINTASGLITPDSNISTSEGETSRVRITISSGTATASDETNVLAATLRLTPKKSTKNLISRFQDNNNINSNSQYEVSTYSPTWAPTLGTVSISDWISSNTAAATITNAGIITAATNFPGNGTKTNTRTTTASGGKVSLVASAIYGGTTVTAATSGNCVVTVYSANPYQITDSRTNDTAQSYWTSYFGNVAVNASTDAVEWDANGNWWMTENLRAMRFPNGTAITAAPASGYYSSSSPIYGYPNFSAANKASMGVLYNFPAAYGRAMSSTGEAPTDVMVQGICPAGWHLPSRAETDLLGTAIQSNPRLYSSLTSANSGSLGNAFKATGTGSGTNLGASKSPSQGGFSALLVGYAGTGGTFLNFGTYTSFWTSSSYINASIGMSYHRNFSETSGTYNWNGGGRQYIFSVRCIKNN